MRGLHEEAQPYHSIAYRGTQFISLNFGTLRSIFVLYGFIALLDLVPHCGESEPGFSNPKMATSSNAQPSLEGQALSLFQQSFADYKANIVAPASKKDQTIFRHGALEGAMNEINLAERRCAREHLTRRAIEKMRPFFSLLDRYSGVIDTCIQYDPLPSSLIWGGIKLIVKVRLVLMKGRFPINSSVP